MRIGLSSYGWLRWIESRLTQRKIRSLFLWPTDPLPETWPTLTEPQTLMLPRGLRSLLFAITLACEIGVPREVFFKAILGEAYWLMPPTSELGEEKSQIS